MANAELIALATPIGRAGQGAPTSPEKGKAEALRRNVAEIRAAGIPLTEGVLASIHLGIWNHCAYLHDRFDKEKPVERVYRSVAHHGRFQRSADGIAARMKIPVRAAEAAFSILERQGFIVTERRDYISLHGRHENLLFAHAVRSPSEHPGFRHAEVPLADLYLYGKAPWAPDGSFKSALEMNNPS